MSQDHEARIEQLEIGLAHASRTIEELNGVVVDQARQIDRLTRLFSQMTDQVGELMDNVLPAHQIDKPPHY
ncbi:SlyX family protein [Roseibium aggregatum]|uniref:SlyX family protein n=1 Tax=Roseibium aggregatum TaxID=187304 RepID=A0A939J0A2_9HYPH|nr:SlyX family protein [Roseibium aggregatum]MBN9669058.1 SlyX family protein [Roseibium aggregatum]